jgi:hypothetical protein
MGAVRLYIEQREGISQHQRPPEHIPVIDVAPEHVAPLRRSLRRKGYEVLAIPI